MTRGRLALSVLLFVLSLHVPVFAQAPSPVVADYHFRDMHTQPWFWDVLAASAVGWVIGIVKGFSTSGDWIRRYWSQPPLVVIFALDLIVFVVVGAYFGTGIYNPRGFLAALAAGLSWPVGLGALATKD